MRTQILIVIALGAALLGAAPAHAVQVGIADNKADMWSDERFNALGIKAARVSVPWDFLRDAPRLQTLDAWMAGAKAAGAAPLVTFDRSRSRPSYNPTPAQMAGAQRAIRARYGPWVRNFATWNEANIAKRPELVARWWRAMRQACASCKVLGADLLDRSNVATWAQRFVRAAGRSPRWWGLHNYSDANRFTTTATRRLLHAVRGEIWLTETGGVVGRRNGSGVKFAGASQWHAARATRFLFERIVPLSRRITRVYLYHWNIGPEHTTWDSGLIAQDGSERPALAVLRDQLGRLRGR